MATIENFRMVFRNSLTPDVRLELCEFYGIQGNERYNIQNDNLGSNAILTLTNYGKIDTIQSLFGFRDELQISGVFGFNNLAKLATFITNFLVSILFIFN